MVSMIIFKLLLFASIVKTLSSFESSTIDLDDILRADLMPSSLMMIDGPLNNNNNNNKNNSENGMINNNKDALSFNGSWFEAYATMGFHRKMFNEYLCRNFVADTILTQIQKPSISDRIGKPFQLPPKRKDDSILASNNRKSRADFNDVKDDLLSDPGSSNYRDWLTKTTTLEDIYKHYEKEQPISRNSDEPDVEYEGGEITGYAMPGPQHGMRDYSTFGNYGPFMPNGMPQQPDADKHGGGYDYIPHHVHFHNDDEEKTSGGGLSLPDVFDVSLTALAFLSFGIFILQVIMCISMNKVPQMMPMMDAGGETETLDEIRFRRDVPDAHTTSLNELTKRVLISIETGLAAEKDEGVCLRRSLCENNKYSRTLKDNQKFWVPVWGLGMSWLSSRLIHSRPSATVMLESLRACALGLANADCSISYSNCNLNELLMNQRGSPRRLKTTISRVKGDSG